MPTGATENNSKKLKVHSYKLKERKPLKDGNCLEKGDIAFGPLKKGKKGKHFYFVRKEGGLRIFIWLNKSILESYPEAELKQEEEEICLSIQKGLS